MGPLPCGSLRGSVLGPEGKGRGRGGPEQHCRLLGGASWLRHPALWRLPPSDAAFPPALDLHQQKGRFPEQHQRLSLGCPVLDGLLRGGLPLGGITELAGRSSVGKTQLALQLCLAVQLPRRLGGLEAGECRPVVEGRGRVPLPCWPLPIAVGTRARLLRLFLFIGCGCLWKSGQPCPTGTQRSRQQAVPWAVGWPTGATPSLAVVTPQPAGPWAPWLHRGRVRVHGGRVP